MRIADPERIDGDAGLGHVGHVLPRRGLERRHKSRHGVAGDLSVDLGDEEDAVVLLALGARFEELRQPFHRGQLEVIRGKVHVVPSVLHPDSRHAFAVSLS